MDLYLIVHLVASTFTVIDFSLSNEDVSALSDYNFIIRSVPSAQSNHDLQLSFPSTITLIDADPYSCNLTGFRSGATCKVASNILTVASAFSSSTAIFTIKVINVQNPPTEKQTNSINISLLNSSGSVVDSLVGSSILKVQANAVQLASAGASPGSNFIGKTSTWQFSLTPSTTALAGSNIIVNLPYWDYFLIQKVGSSATPTHMCELASLTCQAVSSNLDGGLSCSYDQSTRNLIVTNGLISNTTDEIIFTVEDIRNPPGPDPFDQFEFRIADSSNNAYQTLIGGTSIQVQVTDPGLLTNELFIVITTPTVQERQEIYLEIVTSNPLYKECLIDIIVPAELAYNDDLVAYKSFYVSSVTVNQIGTQNIQLSGYFDDFFEAESFLGFTLAGLTAAQSTKPIGSFEITTQTKDGNPIDTGTISSISFEPGTIEQDGSNAFVTPTSSFVNATTKYTFQFSLVHTVDAGGSLTIIFPNEINPTDQDSTTSCIGPLFGIDSASKCEIIGQTLTITNCFPSDFTGGVVKFSVDNVLNSSSTQESSSFTITSHPSDGQIYKIDEITSGVTVTATPAPLTSASVYPASDITGDVTEYEFWIEISSLLPVNGYIIVIFPNKVSIIDTAAAEASCAAVQNLNSGLSCTATSTSIRVNNGVVGSDLPAGTLIKFSVGSVWNPPSTQKYQSFSITTYESNGNSINQTTSGIFVQVGTANQLINAQVALQNNINGEVSQYDFTITVFNETPQYFELEIHIPAQVQLESSPNCLAGNNITNIVCTQDASKITATIQLSTTQLIYNQSFQFSITNFINPGSTRPTDTFKYYTFSISGFKIDKKESGSTIHTTTAASILDMVISPNPSLIAVTSVYTFSYTPINTHPIGTTIQITVPNELSLDSPSCSTTVLDPSINCLVSGNVITISNAFSSQIANPDKVQFKIAGIVNPTTTLTTSPWRLVSKDTTYLIDKSEDITTEFTCLSPCLDCQTTADFCILCDEGGSTPYLYNDTCNSACEAGFTDVIATTEKVCIECTNNCLECQDATDFCTACDINGSAPYLYNDQCNANCLANQYGEIGVCYDCPNPCSTCDSSTICTSCTIKNTNPNLGSQTYLHNDQCVITCPKGFLENDSTYQCDQCDENCTDCQLDTTVCIECQPDERLQEGVCVLNCPDDGTFIDDGTNCLPCEDPCATCEQTVSKCLTCKTGILYNNTCIDVCPDGTVKVLSECKPCAIQCGTCSPTISACLTCATDYFKWKSQCVAECPSNAVAIGNECILCDICATCQGDAQTCTSCYAGTYLYNEQCVSECPTGLYVPINRVCTECNPDCKTCAGQVDYCKSCHFGLSLYQGDCILTCPDGTIDVNGICTSCDSNCATCEASTAQCTSCPVDKYLFVDVCVDACDGTSIMIGNECKPCNTSCHNCETTTSNCTSCKTNQYLYNNFCYTQCPSGYAPEQGVCKLIPLENCSINCTDELLRNSTCDTICNVEACNYDQGICIDTNNCDDGFYEDISGCLPCSNNCLTCQTENTCLTCKESGGQLMLLYDGTCYTNCPSGTFKNGFICSQCDVTCSECALTADNCIACSGSFLLYNNQCINSCPTLLTIEDNGTCIDCSINCKYCETTIDNCTACNDTLVLYQNECRAECPTGYIPNGSECQKCADQCLDCVDSITKCISCTSDKFLYNNQCLNECPQGTYPYGQKCLQCQEICIICSGALQCSVCATGYVLFQTICLVICPTGYEDNSGVCKLIPDPTLCAAGCTTDLLANTECDTACDNKNCNFDNQVCNASSDCPLGQYLDGTDCIDCSYPCSQCISPTQCTSCAINPLSNELMLLDGETCVDECAEGQFKVGVYCQPCDSTCKDCNTSATTCISCDADQFLYQSQCLIECPQGTIAANGLCIDCSDNCATCIDSQTKCLSCNGDLVLYQNQCIVDCPQYTTLTSSSINACQDCVSPCLDCNGETNTCIECNLGQFLYENTCVDQCPQNITVVNANVCENCQDPCVECQDLKTTCTSCNSSTVLYQNLCLDSCPSGYQSVQGVCELPCSDGCTSALLQNTACDSACNTVNCNFDNGYCSLQGNCDPGQYEQGDQCLDCIYPCNLCSSDTTCISCASKNDGSNTQLLLYNGSCIDQCLSGTYQLGIICLACDSICETCEQSATNCTSCPTNQKLYQNQCIAQCPTTTVEINQECQNCTNDCLTCQTTTSNCSSCDSGFVLIQGSCLNQCDPGFTITSSSNGECVACESPCSTCLNETTQCTSCISGLLNNSTCVDQCPIGYTNTTDKPTQCQQCDQNCLDCETTLTNCTACPDGQQLTQASSCQVPSQCPDGQTTTSTSNGACVNCLSPCATCEQLQTQCSSCTGDLILVDSTCKQCESPCIECQNQPSECLSCIDGYYLNGTQCVQCNTGCSLCSSETVCTGCTNGYYLNGDQCLICNTTCLTCQNTATGCTGCKDGELLLQDQCGTCQKGCQICSPSFSQCTQCLDGYNLVNSLCVNKCSDSNCKACASNVAVCEECQQGYTLINEQCQYQCLDQNCISCATNKNICTGCDINYTLVEGSCVYKCNDVNCLSCPDNICQQCSANYTLTDGECVYNCSDLNCIDCTTNKDACTECDTNYILEDDKCVYKCTDQQCIDCNSNKDICQKCKLDYILNDGQCDYKCQDTSCLACDADPKVCEACDTQYTLNEGKCDTNCSDQNCKDCLNDVNTCKTCQDGYSLVDNLCVLKCTDQKCTKCETDLNVCQECMTGFKLVEDACQQICKDTNCEECQEDANVCQKCTTGFDLVDEGCQEKCKDSNCNKCQADSAKCEECKENYILVGNLCDYKCVDENCNTCNTNSAVCEICNTGFDLINGQCIFKCSDLNCQRCDENPTYCDQCTEGYTANNGYCQYNCADENCSQCEDLTCLKCKDNFDLIDNECIYKCQDLNCLSCDQSIDSCELCLIDYNLVDSKCVYKCDDLDCAVCEEDRSYCEYCKANYIDIDGQCEYKCADINCWNCQTERNTCEQCVYNYLLQEDGTCKYKCEDTKCIICQEANQCTLCQLNYLLQDNGTCRADCNDMNCIECRIKSICTECDFGYGLIGSECKVNCDLLPDLCRVEKADEEDDITPVDLYGLPVYILVAMTIIFSLLVLVSKFTSKNVHKTIPNLLAFYGIVELSERLMLMAFLWLEKGEHQAILFSIIGGFVAGSLNPV